MPPIRAFASHFYRSCCPLPRSGSFSTGLPATGYSAIDEHRASRAGSGWLRDRPGQRSNHNTQIAAPGPSGVRVSTWSGEMFYPLPLLTIPGHAACPSDVTLSYNSSWHHDYGQHYGYAGSSATTSFYVRHDNGDITVVWENGRSDRFIKEQRRFPVAGRHVRYVHETHNISCAPNTARVFAFESSSITG